MNNVTIEKNVTITLTAEDWELYTASMDCGGAANAINQVIEASFNSGKSKAEVMKAVLSMMKVYSKFGALDSEPLRKLDSLLSTLYQKD